MCVVLYRDRLLPMTGSADSTVLAADASPSNRRQRDPAVQLGGLTVRYGARVAVESISASFAAGAVALLGRNGAGKSSILKSVLGLVPTAAGDIRVLGQTLSGDPRVAREVRQRIGYMPERDAWVAGLNGFETVALCGRLSGLSSGAARRRAHDVLWMVGLEEARYRAVAGYSAGMRQKVKLAATLAHDPDLLLLDEPTNGLDPAARVEMLELIGRLVEELGKSVILSSHILPDVERVCRDVVLLDQGKVLLQGSLRELTREPVRHYRVEIVGLGSTEGLRHQLESSGLRRQVVGRGPWCSAHR